MIKKWRERRIIAFAVSNSFKTRYYKKFSIIGLYGQKLVKSAQLVKKMNILRYTFIGNKSRKFLLY